MRILVSAFACAPGMGSEEGVGWETAVGLASRGHQVLVLTAPRFERAIAERLPDDLRQRLVFSFHDFAPALRRLVFTSAAWQAYYHAWQLRIGTWARGAAERFQPDLMHHVTYARYWTPTSLHRFAAPLIWGPLGGGDDCPAAFLPALSPAGRWSTRLRAVARAAAEGDPALRRTAARSALGVASTGATAQRLRTLGCREVRTVISTALPDAMLAGPAEAGGGRDVFCCIGRLLEWKGQWLALRAFAAARPSGRRLVILGDGPARPALERLARELGISAQVEFAGQVSREAARSWLRRSLALVHPALHDQAPTVVFEALAVGTPVIGLALGGLPAQTDEASAILVRATSPEQATADLSAAIRALAGDPDRVRAMSEAARRRAEAHTWSRRLSEFDALYAAVTAPGARRN